MILLRSQSYYNKIAAYDLPLLAINLRICKLLQIKVTSRELPTKIERFKQNDAAHLNNDWLLLKSFKEENILFSSLDLITNKTILVLILFTSNTTYYVYYYVISFHSK